MRNAQATVPLYVRLKATQDTAMRKVVRASPSRYRTVAEFVRDAIEGQLKKERRQQKEQLEPLDTSGGM